MTEPLIHRHLGALRLANRRALTIYARERVLVRLTEWAQGPVLYLTANQLAAYQQWRATGDDRHHPLSPQSLRIEVSHLRGFYQWAVLENLRDDDPTVRLVMPKRKDYECRPLGDDQFVAALAGADPHMAAMLGLARYGGLRACEIAKLDWRDVRMNAATPVLTVRDGKGGYTRTVHLSPPVVEILRALPDRTGPVIPRADGLPGCNAAARISQRAAAYLRATVSTEKGEALHALRHAFGNAAYASDRDIRSTQAELGHRSVATTQIYTAVSDVDRIRAVEGAAVLRLDKREPQDPAA